MRKIFLVMLVSITLCFALAGCGEEETSAGTEPQKEALIAESIVGIWECENISMDGITTEEMEELYDMEVSEMAALTAYSDGTADFSFVGDGAQVKWKETDGGYSIILDGEEMPATLKDNKLEVVSTGGDAALTMVFAYKGRISEVIAGWNLKLTDEEVLNMSNFMAGGSALIVNDKLYGVYGGAEYGKGAFCVSDVKAGGTPSIKNEIVIWEDCYVNCLCEYEGAVYGVLNFEKIVKVVGSNIETVYEGFCDYMQIVDGKIYFCGEDYKFYSIDMDGSNKTLVIDKKDMYYAYVLPNGMMIYQDDPDNESLHIYNLETKEDYKLNNEVSYTPVIHGDYIYYVVPAGDNMYNFKRIDLYTGEVESAEGTTESDIHIFENGNIVFSAPGNPVFSVSEWDKIGEGGFSGMVAYIYYSNGEVRVIAASDGELFICSPGSDEKTSIGYGFAN